LSLVHGAGRVVVVAGADQDPLHRSAGRHSIHLGVVSADILAFRRNHGALRMHGGVPVKREIAYGNVLRYRH
jgi:hypothetical protein